MHLLKVQLAYEEIEYQHSLERRVYPLQASLLLEGGTDGMFRSSYTLRGLHTKPLLLLPCLVTNLRVRALRQPLQSSAC